MDGHAGVGHPHQPKPGDISICVYCGTLSRYSERGLIILTQAEIEQALVECPKMGAAIEAVAALHRSR